MNIKIEKNETQQGRFTVGFKWFMALFTVLMLCQQSVIAANPVFLGRWPLGIRGPVQSVQVVNDLAFCAIREGGLSIVDISNAANPSWVGGCDTPSSALDISVAGSYAYIADRTALQIIDISNPSAPALVGTYTNCDRVKGVVALGSVAYIADGTNGLQIVDATVASAPVRIGGCTFTNGFAEGVAVNGNFAYVAMGTAGLLVVDISNPAAPVLSGRYNTPGYALRVAVDGNYAYVADGNSGLQIIDITSAASPVLAGTFSTGGYVQDIKVVGSEAYVADSSGLSLVDISVPGAPTLQAFHSSMDWVGGVYLSSNRAYLAAAANLEIVDVSSPTNPALLGTYNSGGNAFNVKISGSRAYVADTLAGLHIIDITDPANMIRTGLITNRCYGVTISDTNLILASESEGINIFGTNGSGGWTRLGNVDTDGYAYDVSMVRNVAYVMDGANGLETYDLSASASPRHLGHYKGGWFFEGAIVGNYGFVADGTNGMEVFSFTNASAPTLVALYPAGSRVEGIAVSGNSAYLASGSAGLEFVNISNPKLPAGSGTYNSPGTNGGVAIAGDYAYLADGTNGLEVVDITTKTKVGGHNSGGFAEKVAISGNYAFVADSTWGLLAYQVAGLSNESPKVIQQPESRTVNAGSTVSFAADAQGAAPLSYQWRLNGTNLDGATASSLTVTDVAQLVCGNYSVVVTNGFGADLSTNASLQLVNPAPATNLVKSAVSNRFQFNLLTQTNVSYVIEYKDALDLQWQLLNVINGNGAVIQIADAGASVPYRFYRIKVP